jgi:hypothetical protein
MTMKNEVYRQKHHAHCALLSANHAVTRLIDASREPRADDLMAAEQSLMMALEEVRQARTPLGALEVM